MKRKIITLTAILIITMLFIYNIPYEKYFPVAMNDDFFITKIAKELEVNKEDVTILDKVDIQEYKIIGFYVGENPHFYKISYATFKKNSYDHYCVDRVNRLRSGLDIVRDVKIDTVSINGNDVHVILSTDKNLAKIEFKNNSQIVFTKEITTNPSMTVVELDYSLFYQYNFYDKDGNEIR